MLQELKRDKPLHFPRAPGMAAPKPTRKEIAAIGETIAAGWFEQRGYSVVERNWRCGRFGELDLIMRGPDGHLAFIEVKTRRSSQQDAGFVDLGFDSIRWRKRRKILLSARSFLARTKEDAGFTCDAVLVTFDQAVVSGTEILMSNPQLLHIQSAFNGY